VAFCATLGCISRQAEDTVTDKNNGLKELRQLLADQQKQN
jgi:hypothetical protein